MSIRVSLVDDHQLVAEALSRAFGSEEDIEVVGTARCLAEIPRALAANPDVVLMDYLLPDGSGADGVRLVKSLKPATKVIMLTAVESDRSLVEAAAAGADDYLTKGQQVRQSLQLCRRVGPEVEARAQYLRGFLAVNGSRGSIETLRKPARRTPLYRAISDSAPERQPAHVVAAPVAGEIGCQ